MLNKINKGKQKRARINNEAKELRNIGKKSQKRKKKRKDRI